MLLSALQDRKGEEYTTHDFLNLFLNTNSGGWCAFQGSRGLLKKFKFYPVRSLYQPANRKFQIVDFISFTESKRLDHSNYCKAPALPEIRNPSLGYSRVTRHRHMYPHQNISFNLLITK